MAFSFSVNNQNGNGSSGNTFGGDNSGTDNNSNNNLSFGSSNMNSTGLNLNKSSGNKGPSFNFGSQSQSGSLSANGNTNGTFNFGTNNNNKTLPGQNSSVGTKKTSNNGPIFGFGSGSNSAGAGNAKFSFGGSDGKPIGNTINQKANSTASKPTFNFSSSASNEGPTASNKKISFGSSLSDQNSSSKPSFSFGTANNNNNIANASKISFGSAKNNISQQNNSSGTFSLGVGNTSVKSSDSKASSGFALPAKGNQSQPTFLLGKQGNANSAGTSDNSNAKTFNFAGVSSNLTKKAEDNPSSEDSDKNKKQSATSAPKFSFGVTKDDTSKSDSSSRVNKPTFTFGAKAINPVDKDTKTNKSAITEKGSQFTFDSSKNNDKLKQAPTNENNGKKHALPGFKTNDEKKAFVKVEDFKPKQVSITNKNLDDLINKWTNQLSSASKMFKNYGEKIRSWDEVMVSSSEKITKLYSDSLECENKQNKIDQTLSYIERQQEELETLLTGYEKQSESLLSSSRQGGASEIVTVTSGGSIGSLTNDQGRENSYKLAEMLEIRGTSLGTNFSSLISEVNKVNDNFNRSLLTSNSKTDEEEGLLEDVLKLLNSHLESLNWVEESERSLRMQVDKIKKSSI